MRTDGVSYCAACAQVAAKRVAKDERKFVAERKKQYAKELADMEKAWLKKKGQR